MNQEDTYPNENALENEKGTWHIMIIWCVCAVDTLLLNIVHYLYVFNVTDTDIIPGKMDNMKASAHEHLLQAINGK